MRILSFIKRKNAEIIDKTCNCGKTDRKITIKRKFIDELGIRHENTPQGWCSDDKRRCEKWHSQREEWGFDERETWSLDYTFWLWLYERLRAYNEVNHMVDTTFHKFNFEEGELSLQECIDRMISNLKKYLSEEQMGYEEEEKLLLDTIEKFSKAIFYLWW